MSKAFRFDNGGQLRPPVRTPQGFLRLDGYVGRAGIYEYVNTEEDAKQGYGPVGSIRRELRPEEEVFRTDALAGFEGAPLTANHPTQGNKRIPVTADNVRTFEVGTVTTSARRDGDRVAVTMVIKDPKTIARVEKGELNELSPGYAADIHKTPGADKRYAYASNPEGRYDCVQRGIEQNHLALVTHARGGGDLRVRMDGVDDVAVEHRADGFGAKLTSAVKGHQHLLVPNGQGWNCGDGQSGATSWAVSEGADVGHEHPWIRNVDGSITIGEVEGHTHTLLDDKTYSAQRADRHDSAANPRQGEIAMDPQEQIRLLKTQLDESTKRASDLQGDLVAAQTRADSADALVTARNSRIAELEVQLAAGAQAMETEAIKQHAERADAAEQALADLKASREPEIQREAEVRVKAIVMMGPEFRCDGLPARQIQATVIKKFAPSEDVGEAKTATYIATRFDALYDDRMKTARSFASAGQVLATTSQREVRTDSAQTPKKLGWRDQWREGLEESGQNS